MFHFQGCGTYDAEVAGSDSAPSLRSLAEAPQARRDEALRRWTVLRPHVEDGVTLAAAARAAGVPVRTAERWLARYRVGGMIGLARPPRSDRGARRFPDELRLLVEGLALRRPPLSVAHVHREVTAVALEHGWPVPSYATVYAIVRVIDPAMRTLAVDGAKRYREVFDLVYRRQATRPNEVWQADHTQLDLWVLTPSGKPARPWLTVIEDDYSRVITRVRGQLGRALRSADRLGAASGDLAQEPAWLAQLRHPRRVLHRPRFGLHLPAHGAGGR